MSLTTLEETGILSAGTVRLSRHLGYLYGEDRDLVIMAAACTITALGAGSVCFDVDQVGQWQSDQPIDWPDVDDWLTTLASSPMVSTDPDARDRPLILDHRSVYLTRYWAEQEKIVAWFSSRLAQVSISPAPELDSRRENTSSRGEITPVSPAIMRPVSPDPVDLFFPEPSDQKRAAVLATHSSVCVIAGGPGTGKTTTVARILSALSQPKSDPLRVILTAPTGRAAARLEQAVRENLAACESLPGANIDVRYESGTIHRVLGIKPWGGVDHDANHPLPADVIVVDEASMLSLHLMALLLDAVSDSTRLILVGDPDQLASVEAGAVLADVVANSGTIPVARLTHTYRFSGAIASLAESIRCGDSDEALSILDQPSDQIEWIRADLESPEFSPDSLTTLREDIIRQSASMIRAGSAGDTDEALRLLDSHRLLLAHRHGISGVSHWTSVVRGWLSHSPQIGPLSSHWQAGMPVLITRNDDLMGVFNGDSGVIVSSQVGLRLALNDGTSTRLIAPDMIQAWEPLYASTIHKSQGSQYDTVSLILPPRTTALLTRELFYTAVTRAKSFLRIIGSPDSIRHAIESPALRASGLAAQLCALSGRR